MRNRFANIPPNLQYTFKKWILRGCTANSASNQKTDVRCPNPWISSLLPIEKNQIVTAVFMRSCARRISAGQSPLPRAIYDIYRPSSERAIETCRHFRASYAWNILILDLDPLSATLTDHSSFLGHETTIQPWDLIGLLASPRLTFSDT